MGKTKNQTRMDKREKRQQIVAEKRQRRQLARVEKQNRKDAARAEERNRKEAARTEERNRKEDARAQAQAKAGAGPKTAHGRVASDQTRRMTSIRRKLHFRLIRRKLGIYFFSDLLLFLLGAAAFAVGIEFTYFPNLRDLIDAQRSLQVMEGSRQLWYTVADQNGNTLFHKDVSQILLILCALVGSIIILQLLGLLTDYIGENKRIRKILSPINEIALRADELSRLSFTEDKYHLLEDAIEHIQPGEAKSLSFQDSDLVGVEAAINNLLIRMRDTYRQQARFVNDASHELRTPIAVIQGYVNMLDRWGKEDEKILDESITAIRNEADHMNHLVEQLLFLARGDSGKTAVSLEEVDLAAMMQEVYEESFMIDEAHPYRYRPETTPLPARADVGLLKQAVRILIDNAAKYTKSGDEIVLGCGKTESGGTYIQVQDTGIGMEEADVQHMFERFYRSDEVRSYQGTGLGLSIAKWIVDKHKGHFEILSRTGLGTRIRIILP